MQATPLKKQDSPKPARRQVPDYHTIKKALLDKHHSRCADCYRRTVPVKLVRVWRKKGSPKGEPYILLCDDCIVERRQKEKEKKKQAKKRLWHRKPNKRKLTKESFLNKIRKEVLKKDNYTCVWCGTKEPANIKRVPRLVGLGSLIPESRGGKRSIDNYVACCQKCRPSKGNMLPLEYLWRDIDLDEYLHEQFDYALRVKGDPGKYIQVRFFLFSEVSSFLHRLTNDSNIPSPLRSKAEMINIKLLS